MGETELRSLVRECFQRLEQVERDRKLLESEFQAHLLGHRKTDARHKQNERIVELLGELIKKLMAEPKRKLQR